jgi:hypothetical protein
MSNYIESVMRCIHCGAMGKLIVDEYDSGKRRDFYRKFTCSNKSECGYKEVTTKSVKYSKVKV